MGGWSSSRRVSACRVLSRVEYRVQICVRDVVGCEVGHCDDNYADQENLEGRRYPPMPCLLTQMGAHNPVHGLNQRMGLLVGQDV